ncbi:MAG: 50S ribosomal protein L10 [Phycisphaerales bacterium]
MSKLIKGVMMKEYAAKIGDSSDAMLISIRGMKTIATTKLRTGLRKKNIKVTVIRNSLAKSSFKGTGLENLGALLEGPSALAYGGSVVEIAREIVGKLKDFPGLELKGAVLDGNLFKGDAGCKELAKYPTKAESQAQVVTLIVSPGRSLLAAVKGPGSTIAGILKAVEMKLEKGETIAKVS